MAPPTPFDLEVLFQSDQLLAINKPSGVSLLADRGGDASLWPWIKERFDPVLTVHRLDKGTSGVLVFARSVEMQRHLTRAFAARDVRKFYLARCAGAVTLAGSGIIDLPLMPGRKSRYRVAGERQLIRRSGPRWYLDATPKPGAHAAQTRIRVLSASAEDCLLLAQPLTGRTHQLRVHLSWLGLPIRGDHLYGKPNDPSQRWPRLALHAHRIVLPLPDGTSLTVRAAAPSDM